MKEAPRTLSDADIASRRAVTRRTLHLHPRHRRRPRRGGRRRRSRPDHRAQDPPKQPPPKRDPCRDGDRGPPSDTDGCGRPPIS